MDRRTGVIVVVVFLVLAALSAALAAAWLRLDTKTEDLISSSLPFQRNQIEFERRFPRAVSPLIAVVDAPTPERADWAADRLAERLAGSPELIAEAFRPDGGPFFRRHGLLYLSVTDLERLSTRLADAQPFLGRLVSDPTAHGLAALLTEALGREVDAPPETLPRLLDALRDALPALGERAGPPGEMSWRRVVGDDSDEAGRTQRIVQIRPILDRDRLGGKAEIIGAVRRAGRDAGFDRFGVRLRLTGPLALERDEQRTVIRGMWVSLPVSVVLVALLLRRALRSWALMNASLVTLAVGLCLTVGFTTLAIGRLNLISIAFGVLYIGLGADFAIHLALHIRARRAEGFAPAEALHGAVRDVAGSLWFCAITTMVGFFAFLPTPFVGVSELGLIAGAGMIISLVTTLVMFPALMTILPSRWRRPPAPRPSGWLLWLLHAPERHRWGVLSVAAGLLIAGSSLTPKVRFDPDPLNLRDPDSESVATVRELRRLHASDHWSVSAVAPDRQAAEGLRDRLAAQPLVDKAVWIGSFVPDCQDEKLALIEDLAFLMGPTLTPPAATQAATPAQTFTNLSALVGALDEAADDPGTDAATARASRDLRGALSEWLTQARADPASAARRLDAAWMGSFPLLIAQLREALGAGRVSVESLPEAIRDRWVGLDGAHRVQAFPRADLASVPAMRAFVAAIREVAPDAVGPPISHLESGDAVVLAFREALTLAAAAVVIVLLIAFRSVLTTLEALAPFALAAVVTVGSMVVLDVPFNFANVIALPLLLGVGIDSGIHLVHRSKAGTHDRLLESATARGVLYSALTTIAGFGSLGFSPHPGAASMGVVLTIGMTATLVSTLVALPALLTFRAPALRRSRRADRAPRG